MSLSVNKINWFIAWRLPAAFLCGVRVDQLSGTRCTVTVKESAINRNPFRSMYFAVQAMAAELSTGALMMNHIRESGKNISMLIASHSAQYHKKAKGKIMFTCNDSGMVRQVIERAIESGESQSCSMQSIGRNSHGEIVSEMVFQWTIKIRQ